MKRRPQGPARPLHARFAQQCLRVRCLRVMPVLIFTVTLLPATLLPARAEVKPNPYETIVERNPFGLKPPPPPADLTASVPVTPPTPPATVVLTGITSILSGPRALLEIVPGPGKPMIKPILREGERVESVEVVSINVEKNEVVIRNGTLVTNLTFKVASSTPGPATPPGALPPVLPGMPQPPAHQAAQSPFAAAQASRNAVMVAGGAQPAPVSPNNAVAGFGGVGGNGGGTDASGFRSIPSRNIRSTAPQPELPRDQQHLLIELNRVANEGRGGPPLPPTMFNPSPTPLSLPGNGGGGDQ